MTQYNLLRNNIVVEKVTIFIPMLNYQEFRKKKKFWSVYLPKTLFLLKRCFKVKLKKIYTKKEFISTRFYLIPFNINILYHKRNIHSFGQLSKQIKKNIFAFCLLFSLKENPYLKPDHRHYKTTTEIKNRERRSYKKNLNPLGNDVKCQFKVGGPNVIFRFKCACIA